MSEKLYKLTNNHPVLKAIEEMAKVADEHGVQIISKYNGLGVLYKGKVYDLRDTENKEQNQEFPSSIEFILTYYK